MLNGRRHHTIKSNETVEVFVVSTKVTDLAFLPMFAFV